ncbi:MAG: YbaK/EbsC family protein [Geminicoccaceae bacterium]
MSELLQSEPVRRVQAALEAAGSPARVIVLNTTARSAQEAADSLGAPLGQIVKSLLFATDEHLILALIAGDRRCDTKALREALQLSSEPSRAGPDRIKAETGFTIGGVAPVGHRTHLPVVLDQSLARFDRLFAAAGHPHCVFETSFQELVRLTGGIVSGSVRH